MKKAIIWILIVLLLLGGGGTLYYLFSIGAIGFELPQATEPAKTDLIALYTEAALPTEPAPTEPAPTEPAPTEPAPTEPTEPQEAPRAISADNYFVYDLRDDTFLEISGRQTAKIYPASVTKLMTAYTALQYMDPEEKIIVGDEISLIDWDSSRANIRVGDVLTLKQAIPALLLPSGNDAAYSIAANVGRKISGKKLEATAAINVFVNHMNKTARDLGMENSHFENPDGMHLANHYVCPKDLVTLTEAILRTPLILDSAGTLKYTANTENRKMTWRNTNYLMSETSKYYVPYAIGMKTGYTSYAGNCLLSLFYAEDRLYLVGVFGAPTSADRFADSKQLYESIFEEN